MNKLLLTCGIAAAALTASTAQAAVVCVGNCAPFDENVLIASNNVASPTETGVTNNTGAPILFTSDEADGLLAPSNGQARVEAADGTLSSLMFTLQGGYSFTSAVWNLFDATTEDTLLTITYYTPSANVYGTVFTLNANGNNFMGITAASGESITAMKFELSGGGVADLRQLRLGGVAKVTPPAVPEPATWALMIVGLATVGSAMRRRKVAVAFN